MSNIIIIGAGGHGKVILDTLIRINEMNSGCYNILGFLDDNARADNIRGYQVIGRIDHIAELAEEYPDLSAVIAIGDNYVRKSIYERIKHIDIRYPAVIHPSAVIAEDAAIGDGTVVIAGAVINASATVGRFCIVNTLSSIDHDSVVGDFIHVSPGARLGGGVTVNDLSQLGMGSVVIQGVTIGHQVVIGAGGVVTQNMPPYCTAVGIPAMPIKYNITGAKHEN